MAELKDEAHFLVSELTLRDWFAGQALPGIISSLKGASSEEVAYKMISRASYMLADAMLEARE